MPLSEFHSTAKGKLDSSQAKGTSSPSDLSPFVPDHDFVELLWENRQVVMQAQSNRPKKFSVPALFSSHSVKPQDKEGRDAVVTKNGRYGAIDSIVNDCSTVGPSSHIGVSGQDDEMAHWLNYPIDDYCSEFLSEFSGVNMNSLSTHNTSVPIDRISNFSQVGKGTHNLENGNAFRASTGGLDPNRTRNSQLLQSPQQCQTLAPGSRLRESDFGTGNGASNHQGPCGDLPITKMQKQDLTSSKPIQSSGTTSLMNFSHFSRPVALVKANLQSVERLRSNEMASTAVSSNPMEPTLIEPANGSRRVTGVQGQLSSVTTKANSKSSAQPPQAGVSVEHSGAICQEDASRNNNINTTDKPRSPDHMKFQGSSFTASVAAARLEKEKAPELIVASSSVCSGSGAHAASSDPKSRSKRKSQECEESGYQSDQDLEDDSVGVKKSVLGRSMTTKRSRAAEVHNQSERRRRDRINEKMRALQELIPNCNKVDKASMLDEAIEYLKTLQMQVQIMSMGSGLSMPPMMLPAGMQHIRSPHVGPFSPMGVGIGMGMGLGFRMGMLDMASSPLIPVPPMHGPQFPCPSIPGTSGLHRMPGSSSLQMFGLPGQGLQMPMPRPPSFTPLSGFLMKVNPVPGISAVEALPVPASDSAPTLSPKDQHLQTLNGETTLKSNVDNSQIQTSTQATKECSEQSPIAQVNNQASNTGGGNEAIDGKNVIPSTGPATSE